MMAQEAEIWLHNHHKKVYAWECKEHQVLGVEPFLEFEEGSSDYCVVIVSKCKLSDGRTRKAEFTLFFTQDKTSGGEDRLWPEEWSVYYTENP